MTSRFEDYRDNPALSDTRWTNTELATQWGVGEATIRRWRKKLNVTAAVPRVLIFDIETSPIIGYTWGLYEQNVIEVIQDWKLLTVSYRWWGEAKTSVLQLPDFEGYVPGELDDRSLTQFTFDLLNSATHVVAHNGNKFDIKKMNTKFFEHGLGRPNSYKQIDTLQIARKYMKVTSNRLDYLGNFVGLGGKEAHSGFATWKRCMAGEPKAWAEMGKYARRDTDLLVDLFEELLPWAPSLGFDLGNDKVCSVCGSKNIKASGEHWTDNARYQMQVCGDCGGQTKGARIKKELG